MMRCCWSFCLATNNHSGHFACHHIVGRSVGRIGWTDTVVPVQSIRLNVGLGKYGRILQMRFSPATGREAEMRLQLDGNAGH